MTLLPSLCLSLFRAEARAELLLADEQAREVEGEEIGRPRLLVRAQEGKGKIALLEFPWTIIGRCCTTKHESKCFLKEAAFFGIDSQVK